MYVRNPGHMTKMATMPIYGKNLSKICFSRTGGPISTKLGLKHRWPKHYNLYINHDPVMTLTYFTASIHVIPPGSSGRIQEMRTISRPPGKPLESPGC